MDGLRLIGIVATVNSATIDKMAVKQPHDKSGEQCADCGKQFTKSSATFNLSRREFGFIVHRAVCKNCHHIEHSRNE